MSTTLARKSESPAPTAAPGNPVSETGQGHGGAHLDRPDALKRERFTISELTAEFGISPRSLRFYEEEGLIAPSRQGLTRIYSKRDRARLAWILRAKNVGFSLTEVRALIDLYDIGDGRVEQRRVAVIKCVEKISQLQRQREDLDSAIAELTGFIAQIESLELPQNRS